MAKRNLKNAEICCMKKLAVVLLAILLSFPLFDSRVINDEFQKGMSFVGYWNNVYAMPEAIESLYNLKETGCKWVALVTTWYQEDEHSTEIFPDENATPTDASLIKMINKIHELGMKVMLKPHIDLMNGEWRGMISFENEEDWHEWFNSYRNFICHFASMAENYSVEQFCIGTELAKTVNRTEWFDIINEVREIYSGKLVYAANWDNYRNVTFWDVLDFAGIDAYFPLTDKKDPSLQELLNGWKKWHDEIEKWQQEIDKKVIFTEIGYRSIDGTNMWPWNWMYEDEIDLQEQADCYNATFITFWHEEWMAGIYWWTWYPNLEGGENETGYTPYKKPAEKVLRKYYLEELPEIKLIKPTAGKIYVFDKEVAAINANYSIIVGKITVIAECRNASMVEFYIDDEIRYVDKEKPYEWLWDELAVGWHEIKVTANDAIDGIDVFILNV